MLSTAEAISTWCPRNASVEATRFAKQTVEACRPNSPARARSLLFATSRLADFGISVGLEVAPEVLLRPQVIERFILQSGLSKPTLRTVRTNLRFVATRVLAQQGPPFVALERERAKVPYTQREIASWLALADAQPTTLRRMRANALICLSTGAGLVGSDLRFVTGTDVMERSGGVLVAVRGRRPRHVPVLARYHRRLLMTASYFNDRYLIAGADPKRHNVSTPTIASLAGGGDLGRLNVSRMRATWLTECARQIGLRAFMDAAGISCSQRLGDIVAHLDPLDEKSAVALLGAAR